LVRENIFELLEHLETTESDDMLFDSSKMVSASHAVALQERVPSTLSDDSLIISAEYACKLNVVGCEAANTTTSFEEHVSSSEIHQTYSNRLRLEQRIK